MARSETSLSPPVKYFTDLSKAVLLLWNFYAFSVMCLLCLCACLIICALWSPAGKGLTSWLSFVVSYFEFVTLLSWVIVSFPDPCTLTYLDNFYLIRLLYMHSGALMGRSTPTTAFDVAI